MRRPRYWLRGAVLALLAFALAEYAALTWLAPRYVIRAVERAAGGALAIRDAHLAFPLTSTLTGISLKEQPSASALNVQRLVIRPRWVSFPTRTLWLDAVEIERPFLRLSRTPPDAWDWPSLSKPRAPQGASAGWTIRVGLLTITGGVIEFVDHRSPAPFHGLLDHGSLIVGPVTLPIGAAPRHVPTGQPARPAGMSFALQGRLIGHAGQAAPFYCSGWLDADARDLQAFCQLEPLALAAFEPYFQGPEQLRVGETTVSSTSRWWARANQFTARLQFELGQFSERGLLVRGRPVVNIKPPTDSEPPRLRWEISISGPLDAPQDWQAEFLPGNEPTQAIVERLREYGVTAIRLPLLLVRLAPASKDVMTDIEAASREVQEALALLVAPLPEPPASAPVVELPTTPHPTAEASVGPAEPTQPAATPAAGAAGEPSPDASAASHTSHPLPASPPSAQPPAQPPVPSQAAPVLPNAPPPPPDASTLPSTSPPPMSSPVQEGES
jgi:hypothetical protein